jgi:histone H3/H4
MKEFSIRAMKQILDSNTDKRISKDAAKELGRILETFTGDVAEESLAHAHERERITLKQEDIRKALL